MERSELFNKLIRIIRRYDIPYAIVGRTEGYPENIGSDVDVVIPRDRISDFHRMIWEIEDENTKIVQMFQHEIVAFYYVLFHFDDKTRLFIQPDVCTDYYRNGRLLLTADYLLKGYRLSEQGIFNVLASEKEFLYYLLKKIDKRSLSEDQFKHIRNSYLIDKDSALHEASLFWKPDCIEIIKQSLDSDNYEIMVSNLKILQAGIHSSRKRRFADTVRNIFLKVDRIMKPTGLIIAVMGPDGSGKTTVVNQLKKDIEPAFRRIVQFHLFPIPQTDEEKANENPQGQKKRGFVLSLLKLCYFVFVYIRGHLIFVLPKKIRSTLTIFDRYYDDILVDSVRYRNGTPNCVVKFFHLFIPEPELWLFLDCPTDIIQARKSEVPASETERQRTAYLELAKAKKNSLVLNTNRNVKDISIDACKFICDKLNKRAIKRYKK